MDNPYVLSYFILITISIFHGFVRGFTEQAAEEADRWAFRRGRVAGHREGLAEGMKDLTYIYRHLFGDDETHDLDAITIYQQSLAIASWRRDSDPRFMEHVERYIMDGISRTMLKEGFLNIKKVDDCDKPSLVPHGHDLYVGSVSALKKVPIGQVRLYHRRDSREYYPGYLCDELTKMEEVLDGEN